METLAELYEKLCLDYEMEWLGEEKSVFHLYFSGKGKQYRINVDRDYVGLSVRKKFLKWEYWDSVSHTHYDNPDNTIQDLYDGILSYINWKCDQ